MMCHKYYNGSPASRNSGLQSLKKKDITDIIFLRYGWFVEGLPSQRPCDTSFDNNHPVKCKKGGFVCISHDGAREVA